MKKTNTLLSVTTAIYLLASAALGIAQNVELTSLGTSAFGVDDPSTTLSYTNNASTLTFTAFSGGANYLAGLLNSGSVNWSAYTNAPYTGFALNMSASGTNPDTDFSFDLYDSAFNVIDTYTGFTTGLGGSLSLVNLSFAAGGTGDYSDVVGLGFTFNGSLTSPNTVTVEGFYAVVPEPSTYALLAMSGLAFGGYVIRRRHRV